MGSAHEYTYTMTFGDIPLDPVDFGFSGTASGRRCGLLRPTEGHGGGFRLGHEPETPLSGPSTREVSCVGDDHEGDTVNDPQRDDRVRGGVTGASSAGHTAESLEPRPPLTGQQLSATPYVAAIALSPIVTCVLVVVALRRSVELLTPGSTGVGQGEYVLVLTVSFAIGIGLVVLSWLDRRTLQARGVERPFHWAWSIVSLLIYLIGRSIVLQRRVGGSAAPLWLFLGLSVCGGAIAIIIGISSGVATMDRQPLDL